MNKKDTMKAINWTIFTLVVITAVITAYTTLYDLHHTPAFGEEAQSRAGFRWGTLQMMISIAILIFSALLVIGWKRLFPYNMPLAIIIIGFCYVLFFLTFTIGWVGALGMFGFFIAFLIGMVLIISYSVSIRIERRKTIIKR